MSNFTFLQAEWPLLHDSATRAESLAHTDPRAACFYARRTLELAVAWLYKHDRGLRLPYQDNLNALLHEPSFARVVGEAVFTKTKVIKELGNQAVHSARKVLLADAVVATRELFHIGYWLARTYGQRGRPDPGLAFDAGLLARPAAAAPAVPPQTGDQLQKLQTQLVERDEKLTTLLGTTAALDAELARLREQVAAAKLANAATPDTHDYSEAQTRDYFIDLLLKEAGWLLDPKTNFEIEVSGMPNEPGKGFVDYVLWGDDGQPLALVEAKRTKKGAKEGQQQAKLYADCLERQYGQRPVIFCSNGYEHWIWDDAMYPPRAVQGFYKKAELDLLIQRRSSRKPLASAVIDASIIERYYQVRTVRRIGETFEHHHLRKALAVMATGAGKTRTVIALADVLMRANWVKRVLFLADRVALVNQAVNAFKKHLPDSSPVNLVTDKHTEGRVFVSTYPTMMGLIDDATDDSKSGQKRFGVGHFDLIVIDEAHRSVYQKYRAIFEYFDCLLVGLTATPKDEIDHNTYGLFDLEDGVPTDAYPLDQAVADGHLVPPLAVSVPLKFQRDGIKYAQLSEDEKEQWDALEWAEDGAPPPNEVEAAALNKWLFNTDTVDKALAHLMTRGQKVAGGDRLGKTIVFAKNNDHAEFIAERFNVNYPQHKGEFARVVTYKTVYAQSLIDAFSTKDKAPHIAISVDMLDTGIDVPEVLNLVFFKIVRSRTKFWQMVGRGTRLCPDLFGPGEHKKFFYLFDYCQNLEFFSENPATTDGSSSESLGTRLFKARLSLIEELDREVIDAQEVNEPRARYAPQPDHRQLRDSTAGHLHQVVAAMNVENFVVRPQRRTVEKFAEAAAWKALTGDDHAELAIQVASLPTELVDADEEAKRFDLLVLRTQLAILQAAPGFGALRDQIRAIASALEEQEAVPAIRAEMVLIQAIAGDEWWTGVTLGMLENARKRLRGLVKLIEKSKKKVVYTDFIDELGFETVFDLPEVGIGIGTGLDMARFKDKARQFLKAHEDHLALQRLRRGQALTPTDVVELGRMLAHAGGTPELIQQAAEGPFGLGIFIRSLVGMEREAVAQAFSDVIAGTQATPDQIEFIDMIVTELTTNGVMEAGRLYEPPFVDISPRGPEALFPAAKIDRMVQVLDQFRRRASA
jgi:type I restriction enzyme, R subunit